MSAVAPETLADVLRRLGDVAPARVHWSPRPGEATADDLLRISAGPPRRRVELVDGTLVERTMGYHESLLAAVLLGYLLAHVRPRNLGIVAGPDGMVRLESDQVRLPDVSFTAWPSLTDDRSHLAPMLNVAPDLVVEILSPSNSAQEMARKRRDYFGGGTRLVWEVDPDSQTVTVYCDPANPDQGTEFGMAATLTGGDVLPEFTLSVRDLFGDPQLQPRSAGH